jgi:hypothetical protein
MNGHRRVFTQCRSCGCSILIRVYRQCRGSDPNRAAKPRFIKSRSDFILGGPCRNRTCDQRIKSPLLYLTELTARNQTNLIPQRFVVKGFFRWESGAKGENSRMRVVFGRVGIIPLFVVGKAISEKAVAGNLPGLRLQQGLAERNFLLKVRFVDP